MPERELHQLVVGGVVLDLVDPVAGPVVGAQLGRGPVRLVGEELHALAADEVAEARGLLVDPAAAFARDRRAEDRVADPGVVADERRGWFVTSWVARVKRTVSRSSRRSFMVPPR